MDNKIVNQEWYQSLIEDCKAIITESSYNARLTLVQGYHLLGKRILSENNNFERSKIYGKEIVSRVTQSLGKSERTIWRAMQFAQKYPEFDLVPMGKDISWNKVCNELLPSPKPSPKLESIKGKYNVFVVDPPWEYGTEYDDESRRVASPYEEKSVEEIREWGIKEFPKSAHKDSVIWLWTTHKFLKDSIELLHDWGFEYKLTTVWDKQKLGMGSWLRCQAEFCLLGVKGNYHKYWNLTNERDIVSSPRREHSRKPDEFYDMVKRLCPQGNKIDIFSREKREGFEQYGNETGKF